MKCPSQVVADREPIYNEANQPTTEDGNQHSSRGSTNLEKIVHAAVNALVDFELL